MTRAQAWLSASLVATVATLGNGCGIDEQVHNAALKDRDAQKQKLAEIAERAREGKGGAQGRRRQPRRARAGADQEAGVAGPGRLAPGDRARHAGRRARIGEEAHGGAAQGAGAGRGARGAVPQAGDAVQDAHRRGQAAGRDPREPHDRPPGRQDPVRSGQDRPEARGQGRAHAGDRRAQVAAEPELPDRGPHRQRADQERQVPLQLGPVDGARRRGAELHGRAPAWRRSACPPPATRISRRWPATTRPRTRPRTGASRSRWSRTSTICRRSTRRSRTTKRARRARRQRRRSARRAQG